MTIIALILAAFIIGYLLGDRRGVKEFNRMVVEHNDRLEEFFMEHVIPEPAGHEEEENSRPTLH